MNEMTQEEAYRLLVGYFVKEESNYIINYLMNHVTYYRVSAMIELYHNPCGFSHVYEFKNIVRPIIDYYGNSDSFLDRVYESNWNCSYDIEKMKQAWLTFSKI